MSDKIDPGWVSDRLPTEEDTEENDSKSVLVFYKSDSTITAWQQEDFEQEDLDLGYQWARMSTEQRNLSPYSDYIATPNECLASEQVEVKEVYDDTEQGRNEVVKLVEKIKELEATLLQEQNDHIETMDKLNKARERERKLEQALAESEGKIESYKGMIKEYKRDYEHDKKMIDRFEEENKSLWVIVKKIIKKGGASNDSD